FTRAVRRALPVLCVALIGAAALGATAGASVEVAVGVRVASLRIDAAGDAEVAWVAPDGQRRSLVVSRDGKLHFGGVLSGPDVSHPVATTQVPWPVEERETSDGRYYALQAWQRLDNGPLELRFSRWQGEPTRLSLKSVCCKWGSLNIEGTATFHGRPIY